MKALVRVLGFLLVNAIGFYVGPLLLATAVFKLKLIELSEDNPAILAFYDGGFMSVMMPIWFVCMLFSFASFFLSGIWKKLFLFCPVYIPLLLGIYMIGQHV